jgi:hypothetical protein
MPVVVVISQHLLNVFVQLANKRGLKIKKKIHLRGDLKFCDQTLGFYSQALRDS